MKKLFQSTIISGGTEEQREKETGNLLGKDFNLLSLGFNFYLIEKEEGEGIGIEQLRELEKNLSLKSKGDEEKIVFVKNAGEMSLNAQNAFLKTLEEPPLKTKIILSTDNYGLLLPTIVSRCQLIEIKNNNIFGELEIKEIQKQFMEIQNEPPAKKVMRIDTLGIGKDRNLAKGFLKTLIFALREQLLNNPDNNQIKTIRLAEKYLKYLEANCSVRLTLENFLLDC